MKHSPTCGIYKETTSYTGDKPIHSCTCSLSSTPLPEPTTQKGEAITCSHNTGSLCEECFEKLKSLVEERKNSNGGLTRSEFERMKVAHQAKLREMAEKMVGEFNEPPQLEDYLKIIKMGTFDEKYDAITSHHRSHVIAVAKEYGIDLT